MSQRVFMTALVAVVAACLGFLAGGGKNPGAGAGLAHAEQKKEPAEKKKEAAAQWEYGELRRSLRGSVKWHDGKKGTEKESYKALAKELGFKGVEEEKDSSTQVINALGGQGWELVTHAIAFHSNDQLVEVWTFRRKN
jgi:hypothetical protein